VGIYIDLVDMSYDVRDKESKQVYLNFETRGAYGEVCEARILYRYPFIERADDYICSVERFNIPLQGVPFRPYLVAAVKLVPVGLLEDALGTVVYNLNETFSIAGFLTELNQLRVGLEFILTNDGRIKIRYDAFSTYYILLSDKLKDILNMPVRQVGAVDGSTADGASFTGSAVILDKVDQLEDVQLEVTGLPVRSEFLENETRGYIISDFVAAGSTSISVNLSNETTIPPEFGLSFSPRQNLVLTPSHRRFIDLEGGSPIYDVTVTAVAIYTDGSRNEIVLPPESKFTVKLMFVKKKGVLYD